MTQLTVPPLPRDESLTLLGTILPTGGSSERFTEAILAKAEGNPLFLEELARSAAAADESEADLPVPDAVRALLEARMDHLGAEARRQRLEFIHEEIVDGEPVYVFEDALVWEVARQSLSLTDRQALRRAAGLAD